MDYHSIKELIRKFWLGETSLDEENTLKEYFLYNENPPEEFSEAADYFSFIEEENKNVLGDDFDIELMSKIEALEKKSAKVISLKKIWPILVAACIGLLIAFTIISNMSDTEKPMEKIYVEEEFIDTYDDPEQAYENVRAALMMVSSNLNEGVSYTGEIKKFDQAQKEIKKNNTPKK